MHHHLSSYEYFGENLDLYGINSKSLNYHIRKNKSKPFFQLNFSFSLQFLVNYPVLHSIKDQAWNCKGYIKGWCLVSIPFFQFSLLNLANSNFLFVCWKLRSHECLIWNDLHWYQKDHQLIPRCPFFFEFWSYHFQSAPTISSKRIYICDMIY